MTDSPYLDRASLAWLEAYAAGLRLRLERVEHTIAERRADLRRGTSNGARER